MSILSDNIKVLRLAGDLTQAEMAEILGITDKNLSSWERGVTEPDIEALVRIANAFGVTIDTMIAQDISTVAKTLIGDAHLIRQRAANPKRPKIASISASNPASNRASESFPGYSSVPKVVTVDAQGRENVVFVSQKARAGYLSGYADPEYIATLPAMYWPNLPPGTYRIFEADGVSMQPTVKHRDWLLTRYVENLAEIKDNWVYTVVTHSEGIAMKRFLNRVETDRQLIGKSDNRKYQHENGMLMIDAMDVKEVWFGLRNVTAQLGPPDELYERVTELEARFALFEKQHGKRNLN